MSVSITPPSGWNGSSVPDWVNQIPKWEQIRADIDGVPFDPIIVKASYVIGVIHSLCISVDCLLKSKDVCHTYFPAYGIFASGVELLGRCLGGNNSLRGNVKDLEKGFDWLKHTPGYPIPFSTNHATYNINNLVSLRHFFTHGQATAQTSGNTYEFGSIDFEILSNMPERIGYGAFQYWEAIKSNPVICDNLAKANVIPLRGFPIKEFWKRIAQNGGRNIKDVFKFDWSVDISGC